MWLTYLSLGFSLWSAKDYVVDFFKGLKISNAIRKEKKLQRKLAKQAKKEAKLRAQLAQAAKKSQTR
jgi:hypothetical protein